MVRTLSIWLSLVGAVSSFSIQAKCLKGGDTDSKSLLAEAILIADYTTCEATELFHLESNFKEHLGIWVTKARKALDELTTYTKNATASPNYRETFVQFVLKEQPQLRKVYDEQIASGMAQAIVNDVVIYAVRNQYRSLETLFQANQKDILARKYMDMVNYLTATRSALNAVQLAELIVPEKKTSKESNPKAAK